jgi:predicted transcriptional regulator
VNFNVYVDDITADKLKRLARKTGATRNALVREAIAVYLERGASEWPAIVTEFEGDASVRAFETARAELAAPVDDPFAIRRKRGSRRARRNS